MIGPAGLDVTERRPRRRDTRCFVAGTLIAGADGAVPVETLRPGDLVATVHGGPLMQPLIWVGELHVNIARHPQPALIAPVVIHAGALGEGVPFRDLRVSPDHALFLGGRLVPARLLLNGSSIVQDAGCRDVTYHHIELARHGLVVSEGAVSETYIDEGSRDQFDHAVIAAFATDGTALHGNGRDADAVCAPVLAEGDPALDTLRRRLFQRPR